MTTDLAVLGNALPSTQAGSDEDFAGLAQNRGFLNTLRLFTGGKMVQKGNISSGEYGIQEPGGEITRIGRAADLLVLARRPKAMEFDVNNKPSRITYNAKDPVFQEIAQRAESKDRSCQYGPSFLVFERTTERFLEFFCGTPSTRSEAGKIYGFLPVSAEDIAAKEAAGNTDTSKMEPQGPQGMTLKSRLVETKEFSYYVPVIGPCSAPFNVPATNRVIEEITKFVTAKGKVVEKATQEEVANRRAR